MNPNVSSYVRDIVSYGSSYDRGKYKEMTTAIESLRDLDSRIVTSFGSLEALRSKASQVPVWQNLKREAESLFSSLEFVKNEISMHTKEYAELTAKNNDSTILYEYYKRCLDCLSDEYVSSLSAMLTDVYRSVYSDNTKSVRLSIEEFRNKKVIRLNIINNIDGVEYTESLDSDGGSAKIILGSVICIYFILLTGIPRVMFFDESVSALETSILHKYLQVLKKFSQELGFKFIIIDHSAYRMKGYIDKVYTVENGVYRVMDEREITSMFVSTGGDR